MIFYEDRKQRAIRLIKGIPSIFKTITAWLILPFLFTFSVEYPSIFPDQDLPSCEIDLSLWGLEEPSEIGYLSAGVVHKNGGDELIVYDIRKKKPVVQEPSHPQSRVPPFQGDVFLVDDFEQGSANLLGGYFSRLFKAPAESHLTLHKSPDGRRSLCFAYSRTSAGFAGFWIQLYGFKSPPVQRIFLDASRFAYLTFDIRGEEGDERLTLQVADYTWEKKEDSIEVGDVGRFLPAGKILESWQRAQVPIHEFPESLDKKTLASLVFLARPGSGKVYIDNLSFTTKPDAQFSQRRESGILMPSAHRGMWVWKTKDLLGDEDRQAQLVRFAGDNGITEIFLQLPYEVQEKDGEREIIWDRSSVASLLSSLHREGIKVHALDGDPRFALREWHDHLIATARSIVRFNQSMPQKKRFDGLRYDNEPYLLPNFAGIQKESVMEQYLDSLRILKEIAGSADLEFGVDIPFWFDEKNEFFEPITVFGGSSLSERVLDIVDNIGIMDYRTEAYGPDGIIVHALGELRCASEHGKKIFIGLETAEVPDETLLEFGRSPGPSRISMEKREGTKIFLRWFGESSLPETGGDAFLFQQKETFVPSEKLSFYKKNIEELKEVMEAAESEFQKYSGFYGFALHYYESYRLLEQKKKTD
jgi:hypothetical protein